MQDQKSASMRPDVSPIREVRLAIVMYGGSSLAVYMNGVAQELLWLVKATAPSARTEPGSSSPARFADDELSGTGRIYRKLGQYLSSGKADPGEVATSATIRTRFVIDILSGTSAGGINAVFLAKALANMQEIRSLKDLWIQEGDISVLINDKESIRGLPDLDFPSPPKSLLNGRRMYWKLLSAFNGMDGHIDPKPQAKPPVCDSTYVEQLDLYVTATDLGGVILPIPLADRVIYEPRHRNVFHFIYATEEATGDARNDFQAVFNPFLAFAARCTSSLPFVFEPMTLGDTDNAVQSFDPFRGYEDVRSDSPLWNQFIADYRDTPHFPARAFGDGGALDNKPFSYATETLLRRRADVPVDRKLLFIEPDPADNKPGAKPDPPPDALMNLMKQLHSLPRKETIREDIQRVIDRNREIVRIDRVLSELARDIMLSPRERTSPMGRDKFSAEYLDPSEQEGTALDGLLQEYGMAYSGYQKLRVAACTDDLTTLVSRLTDMKEDSALGSAMRYLVKAWRDKHYSHYAPRTGEEVRAPFAKFLVDFDITFDLRQLTFLQAKVDELFDADIVNDRFRALAIPYSLGRDPGGTDVFRTASSAARASLGKAYTVLRTAGRRLRTRSSSPLLVGETLEEAWDKIKQELTPDALAGLLSVRTEQVRQYWAADLETKVDASFVAIAAGLQGELARARDEAASELDWLRQARARLKATRGDGTLAGDTAEEAIQEYLVHYFDFFFDYDMAAFPMTYGTDLGEADEVEIFRISPKDATSLLNPTDPDNPRTKVGGAQLGHFGGFLDRLWRENDIMWGRLDGAERLIQALLPAGDEADERQRVLDALVLEAHTSILDEELRPADRMELTQLLAKALAQIPPEEQGTDVLETFVKQTLGAPLDPNLQKVLRATLTKEDLARYYGTKFSLDALQPGSLTKPAARGIHVAAQVLKGSAEAHGIEVASKPLQRVAKVGQLLTTMVEVAAPNRLAHIVYRHWLALAYFFELLLLILGAVFHVNAFLSFAWTALAVTTLFSLAVLALSAFTQSKPSLYVALRLLLVLVGIVLVAMVVFERKHLGQDLSPFEGKSWRLPGLLPFEGEKTKHLLTLVVPFLVAAAALFALVSWQGKKLRIPLVTGGMLSFEFAGTRSRARQILEAWGTDGRRLARSNIRLDYIFLVTYSIALFLACGWAVGKWRNGSNVMAWIGFVVAWGQLLAGVLDATEDRALTWLLRRAEPGGDPDEAHPRLARICAASKFWLIAAGIAYFLSGLARWLYAG